MSAQYLLALIYTTKMCLKKQCWKEVLQRERAKLRKGRLDEIKRREQKINNELFQVYFSEYQSPSNMYKTLSKTTDAVNDV